MIIYAVLFPLLHLATVRSFPHAFRNREVPDTNIDMSTSLATLACPHDSAPELARLTALLPKVLDNAVSITNKSWEIGALTQGLLEVYDPDFTPLEWSYSAAKESQIPWRVLDITRKALEGYNWSGSPGPDGGEEGVDDPSLKDYLSVATAQVPLMSEALVLGNGSAGDPCAVGPAVWLMAQIAERSEVKDKGYKDSRQYAWAVGNQLLNLTSGLKDGNGEFLLSTIVILG